MSHWISILNLALELPLDTKEDDIWNKLLANQSKFGEIFISTLLTIDIVRLPFIDYSFIRYYCKTNSKENKNIKKIFLVIQNEFQAFLKERAIAEILSLKESDKKEFKTNLSKLKEKLLHLSDNDLNKEILQRIIKFLENLQTEIKELEENKDKEDEDLKN